VAEQLLTISTYLRRGIGRTSTLLHNRSQQRGGKEQKMSSAAVDTWEEAEKWEVKHNHPADRSKAVESNRKWTDIWGHNHPADRSKAVESNQNGQITGDTITQQTAARRWKVTETWAANWGHNHPADRSKAVENNNKMGRYLGTQSPSRPQQGGGKQHKWADIWGHNHPAKQQHSTMTRAQFAV
jgi:hypothetical protein